MYKIVDESILFFSRVFLSKFSLEPLHFVCIRVFIVGYEMECEKLVFNKTGCIRKSLVTRMSCEFQSPVNRMTKLYFLSCSDPTVLALQLPACFTYVQHFGKLPLASQSRVTSCCTHLIKSSHSLTHNPYIIPT